MSYVGDTSSTFRQRELHAYACKWVNGQGITHTISFSRRLLQCMLILPRHQITSEEGTPAEAHQRRHALETAPWELQSSGLLTEMVMAIACPGEVISQVC